MNDSLGHLGASPDSTASIPPPCPTQSPDASGNVAPAAFAKDYTALDEPLSASGIIEALLKHPAQIVHAVTQGPAWKVAGYLMAAAIGCWLVYGAVMGSFSGGNQLWVAPLKVAAGSLLSALLCLPSLYIFSCVAGGQPTLKAAVGLLAALLALTGLLLVGLAPIAWLFSQATGTMIFMGCLHLVFWLTAFRYGLNLLIRATGIVGSFSKPVILLWGAIFVLVNLQVATNLRPLIGPFDGFHYPEKMFFLAHWGECLKAGK